jgi:hypothetical protein
MGRKNGIKIEQLDTYGVGHNCLISAVKIGKTTFIVSSYFEKDRTFTDVMDKVIEKRIKPS